MSILFFLGVVVFAPAALTWGLVRLVLWRNPETGRGRILSIAVPLGASLPLTPAALSVALSNEIYNSALIALMGTLLVGGGVGACVCLPVALSLTRGRRQ